MPSRWALSHLAGRSSDTEHAARLLDMASAEGSDLYHTYIRVPRRSWVEVLEDFTSIDITWHDLINLMPVIPPRQFSIASAPSPAGTLELCVGLVQRVRGKRIVSGLASDWLGRIALGTEVPFALVASEFADSAWKPRSDSTLPSSLPGPCLAVCGGTGVAPVRAVSQALAANPAPAEHTRMWTFFGCRHAVGDFLYAAEWAARAGIVDCPSQPLPAEAQHTAGAEPADASQRLTAAFSRDLNRKVYVQHQIAAHAAAVAALLRQDGSIVWLVGASKGIVEGAEDAIKEVILEHGLVSSETAAAQWVASMKAEHRWFAECWS